jgi:DNA-binding transcriptional MocR family regulator
MICAPHRSSVQRDRAFLCFNVTNDRFELFKLAQQFPRNVDTATSIFDPSNMRKRILSEVKRLAAENGGKTPSKVYFQNETGITESEWLGILWIRWNDIINDAGLTPNERQERFSRDLVLDRYAEVCHQYGRPPINAELRLYVKGTANFPAHTTFTRHFGRALLHGA